MSVQQKSKEVNMENINKEDIPRVLKQHILVWLIHSSTGINPQKQDMKDYPGQRCQMEHSTKKFSAVCT